MENVFEGDCGPFANLAFTACLHVSYKSRKLNNTRIIPKPNGNVFGPTVEPYALSEICVACTTNKIPMIKNTILEILSKV